MDLVWDALGMEIDRWLDMGGERERQSFKL
jgi:hypothetical protein